MKPLGGVPRFKLPAVGVIVAAGLVILGIGAVMISLTLGRAEAPKVAGGDAPVNAGSLDPRDINSHNSPSIAQNPVNKANLAVSNRIDSPTFSCALHVSLDAGVRWRQTPLPVPDGEEPKCYAPDLVFAKDGTLHVSFVTLKGDGNVPNAVWLLRSKDGGRTLSDPLKVVGPLAFQARLAADPVKPNRIYLTWLQAAQTGLWSFPEPGYPIQLLRSDDSGATWQGPTRVSAASRARVVAPSPAVGPKGELYVLYLDLGEDRLDYAGAHGGMGGEPYGGHWKLVMARSTDGGAEWSEAVVEERLVPTRRILVFLPPFPSVAVGPAGAVYAAFQDGRSGDEDVLLWASADGGVSFRAPKRVNDNSAEDGTSQYLPKLGVAGDGRLDVVYYDRRADPADIRNEVSLQSSYDLGRTFLPRVRLSRQSFDSRIGFGSERNLPDLGSRLGVLSSPRSALAVWSDTRAGTEVSKKQDIVRAVVEFPFRPALDPEAATAFKYGGIALLVAGVMGPVFAQLRRRRAE